MNSRSWRAQAWDTLIHCRVEMASCRSPFDEPSRPALSFADARRAVASQFNLDHVALLQRFAQVLRDEVHTPAGCAQTVHLLIRDTRPTARDTGHNGGGIWRSRWSRSNGSTGGKENGHAERNKKSGHESPHESDRFYAGGVAARVTSTSNREPPRFRPRRTLFRQQRQWGNSHANRHCPTQTPRSTPRGQRRSGCAIKNRADCPDHPRRTLAWSATLARSI